MTQQVEGAKVAHFVSRNLWARFKYVVAVYTTRITKISFRLTFVLYHAEIGNTDLTELILVYRN